MVFHGMAWFCMVLHDLHGFAWYYMVLHGIVWYCIVLCRWMDQEYSCLTECTSGCRGLRSFETAFFGVVFALFGRSVLPVKEVKGCVWSFVAILESLCNRSTGQGEKSVASLRSSSIISPRLVEVLRWDFSGDCRLRCDCDDCKVLGLWARMEVKVLCVNWAWKSRFFDHVRPPLPC